MASNPIRCTSKTSVGRVRSLNEDAFAVRPDIALWMVADGMGGHNKGNVASNMACEEIVSAVTNGLSIPAAIQHCHQKIQLKGFQSEQHRGMGTTVVCVSRDAMKLQVYWVGDSRAYLWHDAYLTQITKDHSIVQNMLELGTITKSQARRHPKRHIITQSVGAEMISDLTIGNVSIDFVQQDKLLICSDGLHDQVSEQEIQMLFEQQQNSTALVDELVNTANEQGGHDNITALILELDHTASN